MSFMKIWNLVLAFPGYVPNIWVTMERAATAIFSFFMSSLFLIYLEAVLLEEVIRTQRLKGPLKQEMRLDLTLSNFHSSDVQV